MTIVEAVLAVSTLWGMYRKSQDAGPPDGGVVTAESLAAEAMMANGCAIPMDLASGDAVDLATLPALPTLGDGIPYGDDMPPPTLATPTLVALPTVQGPLSTSPGSNLFTPF